MTLLKMRQKYLAFVSHTSSCVPNLTKQTTSSFVLPRFVSHSGTAIRLLYKNSLLLPRVPSKYVHTAMHGKQPVTYFKRDCQKSINVRLYPLFRLNFPRGRVTMLMILRNDWVRGWASIVAEDEKRHHRFQDIRENLRRIVVLCRTGVPSISMCLDG